MLFEQLQLLVDEQALRDTELVFKWVIDRKNGYCSSISTLKNI
jgi:hypothetical protein